MCSLVVDGLNASSVTSGWSGRTTCSGTASTSAEPSNGTAAGTAAPEACAAGGLHAPAPARRQKSYDELDPSAMSSARAQKGNQLGQIQVSILTILDSKPLCSGLCCVPGCTVSVYWVAQLK